MNDSCSRRKFHPEVLARTLSLLHVLREALTSAQLNLYRLTDRGMLPEDFFFLSWFIYLPLRTECLVLTPLYIY